MPLSAVARGRRYRELVALSFAVAGFADARPRADKISDSIAGFGDVLGLPDGVVVRTSANAGGLDDLLREARKLADERGQNTVPLGIQHRPAKSAAESYVVTDLRGAAVLLRALAAQEDQQALLAQAEDG